MSGKNIWILNHYAISPDMAGGTRHYDFGKKLVKKGFNVTIFASGFDHVTKKHLKVSAKESVREEVFDGVRFVWLNTFPYTKNDWRRVVNMISYAFRVIKVAKKFEKPDIIIGSSMHFFAPLAGWWLSRKYKARFIFEVRDLWPQTAIDMGVIKENSILAKLLYIWEKFMYERAEKIIVLLPDAKSYIAKRGVPEQKIVWIPNGVNMERFETDISIDENLEVFEAFKKYKDKFKVVYAGAHGPANGLEVVIETAELLKDYKDIQFILIGDGVEKESLIEMANKKKLTNIVFLSPVPKKFIPTVLRKADLLLHSLKHMDVFKYGISPNKIFDYLASGRPILSNVSASKGIIEEANVGIIVPPENPKLLAEGILKIKNLSEKERNQMGLNGRKYVEQHYDIRKLTEKLIKELEL
ncbi:LOW QUALITY PROTEIN: glycosyltransferase [Thermoanaerobacter siderophilus SR4]|uniref:Glycosyltransferase n=1 Tax=Thermoanaerobacter siderophilus SR4 TaxID=880478 RepID=I8R5D6_9THEO|nr:LOW QUALITY PROTEIN: glycosyltransferase [Thermoanaerobacter siderophilus SR4]